MQTSTSLISTMLRNERVSSRAIGSHVFVHTLTCRPLVLELNRGQADARVKCLVHGAFHLYGPSYMANQTRFPAQGISVLSGTAGLWISPGTAYAGGQSVSLQRGRNLVSAPYPSTMRVPPARPHGRR